RIRDLPIDDRLHFCRIEPCVGERLLLRHVAELEESEQVAAADLLAPFDELVSDGLRAADDGEATLLDVLPGLAAIDEGLTVLERLEDAYRGFRRRISRGCEREAGDQVPLEIPELLLELGAGLGIGFADVDRHQ